MQKVHVLIEALPYIQEFSGKTFVIKYGGSIMNHEESKKAFIEDVAILKWVGINIVIVHGGGPDISKMLELLHIPSNFEEGLRVTDKDTMEVVEMVLSGKINKEIAGELCKQGISALGISGRDSKLIKAEKMYLDKDGASLDIGYVGTVKEINKELLVDLIANGHVPVISPVGADCQGQSYNINGDFAASAIAAALQAEKLILLTDIKGLYQDINDQNSFMATVTIDQVEKYINDGVIEGGMIPKMQCCKEALIKGTGDVHLIDGRTPHSLLLEIFTRDGIGTMVTHSPNNIE